MQLYKEVHSFVGRMRGRLNLGVHLKSISYGVVVAAFVMMLVAMIFVLLGLEVDLRYAFGALVVGVVVYGIFYLRLRVSYRDAARFADSSFKIKDGISSAISFKEQGKEGGIYDLQLDDTTSKVRNVDESKVPVKPDWPAVRVSAVCMASVVLLSLFPESVRVTSARLMKADTEQRTEDIKEYLEKELDEIEKEMTDEEREIFKKSKLAELVESLDKTEDRKEALKKYAEIEKAIRDAAGKNSTYEDERVLQAMALELNKGKQAPELSKALAERKYNDAAKALEKMKPKDKSSAKDLKKESEALRKAAKRMKNAAEVCKSPGNKFCKNASELSESTEAMSKALSKAEMSDAEKSESEKKESNCKNGQCKKSECQTCKAGEKLGKSLAKMNGSLGKLESKRAVLSAMSKLRKKMGMCQSYLLAQSSMPGGKKAGVGSEWKENKDAPKNSLLGYNTEVDAQKGEGPSKVAIEEASSGSGIRRLDSKEKSVEFQYQVESFMRREDVSESLKNGVKTYFEIIHEE